MKPQITRIIRIKHELAQIHFVVKVTVRDLCIFLPLQHKLRTADSNRHTLTKQEADNYSRKLE